MALHNSGRNSILLCHVSRRKKKQHSLNSGILPYFLFCLSPSLLFSSFHPSFFFRCREGDKEETMDCARGCEVARLRPLALTTPRCHNRGGRAAGPSQDAVRGSVNQFYMPPLLLAHHASYNSMGYESRIPNGPYDCRGARQAQGSKAKVASQVRATQSKQSEGQSDTRGG
jgi:hypothetical protein